MNALTRTGTVLALTLGSAAALVPAPARACGGFFCSSVPVDQVGERILFTHDEEQNLVTYVSVQYQGEAEKFAWVLPVPGNPTVGVGTDETFRALERATTPAYATDVQAEGTCTYGRGYYPYAEYDSATGAPQAAGGTGGSGGVEVLQSGQAGPYDYKVLAASDPDLLVQWLKDNAFDLSDRGNELLGLYVDGKHNFVAIKLTSESAVDDIRPVVLRYEEPLPCVPLRLTAVAAQPDMSIRAFILADHRAVPQNYFHVRINEARIDWFSGGSNYEALVTEAVDAAPGGQGFVTEYAGPSAVMEGQLWTADRFDLDALRAQTDPVAYFSLLLSQGFRGNRQLLSIFRKHLPLPEALADQGVDERSFYNCLSCWADEIAAVPFDPVAMTDAIEADIVTPLKEAQELLDLHPYLTTLFSTMSPEEMLNDPTFTYNADVPDVPRQHTARAFVECGDGGDYYTSPVRLELPGGATVRYAGGLGSIYEDWTGGVSGGVLTEEQAGPAARIVEKIGESGPGVVLLDNTATIESRLALESGTGGGCAGCSTGGNVAWAGVALALLALRRRK